MNYFRKILIANRGEIALRIIRAANEMQMSTVAVYSDEDKTASHVIKAGEAVSLGDGNLEETYLNIEKIVEAAMQSGADAIHPGYGFLSESTFFAEACQKNGIAFIGPSPEVLTLMGNKTEAKSVAESLGIPILKNYSINGYNSAEAYNNLPYPMLIKSVYGGGGKGMQIVASPAEIDEKVAISSRMAKRYFGNGEIYLEPYISEARHIEIQILADNYGHIVHLHERDCTLQRNYQKIVEEAPAPALNPKIKEKLTDAAIKLCKHVGYSGAGTVEFLVSGNQIFFMEMNPRLQVEHTVTEEVTGIDIVKQQIIIAAGNHLEIRQDDVKIKGHAIQVRLYSEDPENSFKPSSHPVSFFRFPKNKAIRIETAIDGEATTLGSQFDPLIAKIISRGKNRSDALGLLKSYLKRIALSGPATNLAYLRKLLRNTAVLNATANTKFCEENLLEMLENIEAEKANAPLELLTAAFISHNFFPENPDSLHPFERPGPDIVNNKVNVHIVGNRFEIPFSTVNPKFYAITSEKLKKEIRLSAQPFQFEWNNKNILAGVRKIGKSILKVTTEEKSGKFILNDKNPTETILFWRGHEFYITSHDLLSHYPYSYEGETEENNGGNLIVSHLHGKVIDIQVTNDQVIKKGDLLLIIESMKSENHILSHKTAKVKSVQVSIGTQVHDRMPLIMLEEI